MDKNKNIEAAKQLFKKNPNIKELFFTNDGQAFEKQKPAGIHQKSLGGNPDALHRIKNASFNGEVVSMVEDTVEPDEVNADGKVKKGKGKGKGKDAAGTDGSVDEALDA